MAINELLQYVNNLKVYKPKTGELPPYALNTVFIKEEEAKALFGDASVSFEVGKDNNGKITVNTAKIEQLTGEQLIQLRALDPKAFDQSVPNDFDNHEIWQKIDHVSNVQKAVKEAEFLTQYLQDYIVGVYQNTDYEQTLRQELTNISLNFDNSTVTPEQAVKLLEGDREWLRKFNPTQYDKLYTATMLAGFIQDAQIPSETTVRILSNDQHPIDVKMLMNVTNEQLVAFRKENKQLFDIAFSEDRVVSYLIDNEEVKSSILNNAIDKAVGTRELSEEDRNRLDEQLYKVLSEFDNGYLAANYQTIEDNITKSLSKEGSARFYNNQINFDVNAAQKVADTVRNANVKRNEEYIQEKVNEGIASHQLKDSVIEERLSEFFKAVGSKRGVPTQDQELQDFDLVVPNHEISAQQLAEVRKLDPRRFDEIMFPADELKSLQIQRTKDKNRNAALAEKGNLTRSSESFATEIIAKTISQVEKEAGVKVNSGKSQKMFSDLHEALSTLDPQYLNEHADRIALGLATRLNTSDSIERITTKDGELVLSAPSDKLNLIAYEVANYERKESDKAVKGSVDKAMNEVNEIIKANQLSNSEIGERVMQFIAEKQLGEDSLKNLGFSEGQIRCFNVNTVLDLKEADSVFYRKESLKDKDTEMAYYGDPKLMGKLTDKQLTDLMRLDPTGFKEILSSGKGQLAGESKELKGQIAWGSARKGTKDVSPINIQSKDLTEDAKAKLGKNVQLIGDKVHEIALEDSRVAALNKRREAAGKTPVGKKETHSR